MGRVLKREVSVETAGWDTAGLGCVMQKKGTYSLPRLTIEKKGEGDDEAARRVAKEKPLYRSAVAQTAKKEASIINAGKNSATGN